jgi:hypothetical protein
MFIQHPETKLNTIISFIFRHQKKISFESQQKHFPASAQLSWKISTKSNEVVHVAEVLEIVIFFAHFPVQCRDTEENYKKGSHGRAKEK